MGDNQNRRVLSQRERLFIEAYAGDEVGAMRIAGYQGADNYLKHKALEKLRDPDILKAIEKRDLFVDKTKSAKLDREGLQSFWSQLVKNEDPYHVDEVDPVTNIPKPKGPLPIQARLKAAELLGKSDGMFVDKLDVSGNVTITDLVQQSLLPSNRSLDEIEAEYTQIKSNPIPDLPVLTHSPIEDEEELDDLI